MQCFHTTFWVLAELTYLSELDNPAAYSDSDRLCAIACAQLLHDVLDMNFNGSF